METGWSTLWGGRFQKTYFDVRVFNPLAPSNRNQAPAAVYKKHELEKKLTSSGYKRWNTPPSLLLFFEPQDEATIFYKRLHGIAACPEMGLPIQHDPMLATVPPELLPPLLIQSEVPDPLRDMQ